MDRFERLRAGASPQTRILEIGASHAPIAPRAGGWNAETVDHTDTESLRAKYAALGVDTARIEEVNHVWQGGPLDACIPASRHGGYDLLIMSHVVEHIPDLAGLFLAAQKVLSPDGAISLAVPDKRYCFDFFKPLTTTGDLLSAHLGGARIHNRRTAWNHLAYSVTLEGTIAWGQHPVGNPVFIHDFGDAQKAMESYREDGPYEDFHAWQFTPASFALIILELGAIGTIDWHIAELSEAMGCEFFVTLRRGADRISGPALAERRMALLRQAMAELRDQMGHFGLITSAPALPPPNPAVPDSAQLAIARLEQRVAALEHIPPALRTLAAIWRRLRG